MSDPLAVDGIFHEDGRITVRRIKLDGSWHHVQQGRQWVDENGCHLLIMIPGRSVDELLFSRDTLHWQLLPRRSGPPIV